MAKKTKNSAATTNGSRKSESKKDRVIALLRRDGGASLDEITEATGWLPHTARAMLTGLRKTGLTIEKQKVNGTTRYSLAAEQSA